jgi:hypothetical protein
MILLCRAHSTAQHTSNTLTVTELLMFAVFACISTKPERLLTHVLHRLAFASAVCVPGYGIWESSACTPCNYGWYHPGGDTRCTQCPVATFYPPVDGVGDPWLAQGKPLY